MITASTLDAERDQRLNVILLALVKAIERGEIPERAEIIAAHPEFDTELEEFFAGRDCINRLASGMPGGRNAPGPATDLGVIGDFRLLREVGRGGMGIVYEAHQISLDRCVALKVLPFAAALDERQLQRFKNEAHAAALLHHGHIVPIYSVGCAQGVHFYAMQFIPGRSLSAMIQALRQSAGKQRSAEASDITLSLRRPVSTKDSQASAVTPRPGASGPATRVENSTATVRSTWRADYFRRVARMGIEAAEALEHAHQLGVVHRDIKPANLLLDNRGHLWITDFGVALLRRSDGMTTTGELVGTLRYMSAEQAGTQPGLVDHRTDIYSLGATLYELLTLEAVFPSTDPNQLLQQIAAEDPRSPRSLDPDIPADLELIVLKALAKNPAERYATAQELADDLKRFLEDKPVRATRPSLLDRAVKWSRRHRSVVASGVALLALATVGLLFSTVLISRSHGLAQAAYEREKEQRSRAEKNLNQAREVLAFLTQVSANELSDMPEFLPVREKLLTAALQYYEQFVEEHQGDPSILAELDASRAKVKEILSVLSAQQEYTRLMLRVMLLEEKDVKRELGIKQKQGDKLWELFEQLKDQRRETVRTNLELSHEERGKRFKELADQNEKILTAILSPAQARRLKQIALQQYGVQAFAEPEVAGALGLSAEQKTFIRGKLDELARGQRTIYAHEVHPPEADRQAEHLAKTAETNIFAQLSAEQEQTWKEMAGAPFDGHLHFLAKNAFGAGGHGRQRPPPPPPPPPQWEGPKDGPPEGWKGPKEFPKKKKF